MAELSVLELDNAVKTMLDAKATYEKAKEISDSAYDMYKTTQTNLLTLLETAGKTKYYVDGVGTASIAHRYSVKMPHELAARLDLFGWLKEYVGEEGFYTTITIDSRRLNKIYNDEAERHESEGKLLTIPGLDTPTLMSEILFRKEKE